MRVLVTGSDGFIGKNLRVHLSELASVTVDCFSRTDDIDSLYEKIHNTDLIFHLAGINRPKNDSEFSENTELTKLVCNAIRDSRKNIPIAYTSSIQVRQNNPYGKSKLAAENTLIKLHEETGNTIYIYRLPNVFGKWARPNYNSVVATFCHNIANDLPINIHDESSAIELTYIDDLIDDLVAVLQKKNNEIVFVTPKAYQITVGELAKQIYACKNSRKTMVSEEVGTGLLRAINSTYLSYLKPTDFDYDIPVHADTRGEFVEMIKTPKTGQFSYFTALPGITRGGHYHHTKTEKFLVIRGTALFKFRHLITSEYYEIQIEGKDHKIVETVPGWTHDITNIGNEEMIVMLWANEIFNRKSPDTFNKPL